MCLGFGEWGFWRLQPRVRHRKHSLLLAEPLVPEPVLRCFPPNGAELMETLSRLQFWPSSHPPGLCLFCPPGLCPPGSLYFPPHCACLPSRAGRTTCGPGSVCYYTHKWKCWSLSHVCLFGIPWTVPLSVEFSRQEYWSGLPFPFPWDLPDPGIKPGSPALKTDSLSSEPPEKPSYP